MECEGVNSIDMARDRSKVCVVVNTVVDLQVTFCIE
jgi:hypothetical protein